MKPNQPSESMLTTNPVTQLPETNPAFAQVSKGTMTLIDLFDAAGRLTADRQLTQVIELYRLWLQDNLSPLVYPAWFNLGVTLSNTGDPAAAEEAYLICIRLKPDFVQAYLNLGTLQEAKGQPEQAQTTWRKVLEIIDLAVENDRPFYIQALNNLGRLLEIHKHNAEAQEMLLRSLKINPKQPKVITHWVHLRQKQCDWPIYTPIAGISHEEMVNATSALAMLSASDTPAEQLAASRRYVEQNVLTGIQPMSGKYQYRHDRLRIGYLSSDFCTHAVSILIAELLELHDRQKVVVYGFCWTKEDGTPLRARMVAAMDYHIRIDTMSDEQAARCIRDHEIDILIDMHGLTSGMRANILSYRPAPLQMTYLGFPGSTALPEIDYVLCDRFVLPPELVPFFTEKPLYLPNTFQVNDRKRVIGTRPSRADCGLPDNAFVFCSFNNNYKFTPNMFACWMRILSRVPNSILWLVADSEQVKENLSVQAEYHGVLRSRLIFAARVGPDAYLARYKAADLFLDTLPFNAGTTASDALWAGLPLLTCVGHTFAARMAGSLLRAVDLPELITLNLQDYEDKAVELAGSPIHLSAMRQHLADTHLSCALFDSPRFVREFEEVLKRVLSNDLSGSSEHSLFEPSNVAVKHTEGKHQSQFRQSLVIEGWRSINHSFALVNQFQLLEFVKHTELDLYHLDTPFHFPHWNQATNGAGFHSVDESILSNIISPALGLTPDWTFRVYSPVSLLPPVTGGKLAVFLVTELGLDAKTFSEDSDITQFEATGSMIVTPSNWARNRIIDWGFHPSTIHVVPHGVSRDYFFQLPSETIKSQRTALGFSEDEVLLLNVGTAIWNKGIDVLLKGFALARQKRKNLRLVFKDQRNTYGISCETYVQSTLSNAGLLSADVLQAITLIPANLTMDQMNAMYGIADCYVSPYRAEGFNLPVCEAMACGTPVIATAGGATDDFIIGSVHRKIDSKLYQNVVVQGTKICAYCEPQLEHLVDLLLATQHKNLSVAYDDYSNVIEWKTPVDQLISLFVTSQ